MPSCRTNQKLKAKRYAEISFCKKAHFWVTQTQQTNNKPLRCGPNWHFGSPVNQYSSLPVNHPAHFYSLWSITWETEKISELLMMKTAIMQICIGNSSFSSCWNQASIPISAWSRQSCCWKGIKYNVSIECENVPCDTISTLQLAENTLRSLSFII